jgi:NAD(P)-dependent dehydrogenase (short-subunit alcohol dehydrogenase family)
MPSRNFLMPQAAAQSQFQSQPPQSQSLPGSEAQMTPQPQSFVEGYRAAGKLKGKRALVTGGDSGIGRAVAIGFAKEGADVAILYLNEHEDARLTRGHVEKTGQRCLLISGDIGDEPFCKMAVQRAAAELGGLDILVNNAAEQHVQEHVEDISARQLERTFRTNIFSMFYLTKAALEHMTDGGAIINTASVVAYKGKKELMDYAATKGAIIAYTYSLAQSLAERSIRVNAVAPGPIWTPLIPASFDAEKTAEHGKNTLLGRAGQPDEVAPSYVFLAAAQDSSYMTGQVLHPNGGTTGTS